jgi:PAS domain S-box-containing protein
MSDQLPEQNHSLNDFYDQLEEMVVEQARRLINHDLYTKAILSTLPTALVATDRSGRIRSTNRAAEETLGLESLGKDAVLASCFPLDQLLQEKITRCLESGEGFTIASHSLLTAAGNQSIVNIYLRPLRDDEAELCGLLIALEDQTYIRFLQDSVQRYGSPSRPSSVVAESKAMKQLMNRVAQLAQHGEAVLLAGEPGCGKTFVAHKIHEAAGFSSSAPYFVIDCKRLTDKDPRDFLFGAGTMAKANRTELRFHSMHDYGAIHLADGGTLVLQHVEALPLDAHQAIVDYLGRDKTGFLTEINARIMATSCADLTQLAEAGDFNGQLSELLLDRKLDLPTLRERRKDILPLARLFLQESEQGAQRHFSKTAENILISRHYNHNNASELKEAVSLAALVSSDAEILPEYIFTGPKEEELPFEFEISRIPFVNWALQDRVLGPLRYLMLVFFSLIAFSAMLFSDSAIGQLANSLVWGIWWPALIIVFLLVGRLWCTVCPLSKVAYLAKRLLNISNPPPGWLKKHAFLLLPAGFLLLLWTEQVFHVTVNPVATGLLLLSLMSLAAIFAMLFERETWCRYLCPMGNLGAVYSLPATLNVRSNPSVCATLCTTHECHKGSETQLGCPVFHHPLYARDAHVCKLCFNCLKSCTHNSAKLYLRPPLIRIWRQGEISESLGLFALTVCFISPVLLGTKAIDVLAGSGGFSIATLLVIGAALLCRQVLPNRLVRDPEQAPLAMSRIALTLMVIGWGPLTAFQVANFPSVNSLVINGNLGPVWGTLIPSGGLPVLKLVQTGILLFATLLAGITLWGVRQRLRKDKADVSIVVWLGLLGLFAGYLFVNLALVLGG